MTRAWDKANPERTSERKRRWRHANPDRNTEQKRLSNARRMYAAGLYLGMCGFTDSETKEILQHGPAD